MFLPLISRPTRISAYSATLTENIFTNHVEAEFFSGIVINDISDHLPVFAYVSGNSGNDIHKRYVRNFSADNLNNFRDHLSQVNWPSLFDDNDPNISYNNFLNEYSRLYYNCFPMKTLKSKHSGRLAPWMTKALLVSIRKKNTLYKEFIKSPNSALKAQFKFYRNKLNHLIKIANRQYYDQKFISAKKDLKESWKLINESIKRKIRSTFPSSFRSADTVITNPVNIENEFCHYFTSVGPNLAMKIPAEDTPFYSFMK